MSWAADFLDQLFGYVHLHQRLNHLHPHFAPAVLWPYWQMLGDLNLATLNEYAGDGPYAPELESAYCWWQREPPEWWARVQLPQLQISEPEPRCLQVQLNYRLDRYNYIIEVDARRGGFHATAAQLKAGIAARDALREAVGNNLGSLIWDTALARPVGTTLTGVPSMVRPHDPLN